MLTGRPYTKTRFDPRGRTSAPPLLANIYLHYALDLWAHQWRQRQMTAGDVILVRYADDSVMGFQHEVWRDDSWRHCENALPNSGCNFTRIKHGLSHLDDMPRKDAGNVEQESRRLSTFLGSRTAVRETLMRRRHEPIPVLGRWLGRVVEKYLPPCRKVHPFSERAVLLQDLWQEPYAVVLQVRICAGSVR